MKSRYSSLALGLVLCQPLLVQAEGHSNGALAGAIAAALAIGGAVVGGIVHLCHTSESSRKQEAEKEKKKIAEAQVSLKRMQDLGHRILKNPQELTYQNVAALDSGQELNDLKNQVQDFAATIQKQKEELSSVTGKYKGESDEDYYAQARVLSDELVKFEQGIAQCQGLLYKLEIQRDAPLRTVQRVQSFVDNAQAHAHTNQKFLDFITNTYSAGVTRDDIKGLPLVCAAEDISSKLVQLAQCEYKLVEHQKSLQNTDPTAYAALKKLNAWKAFLNEANTAITNTPLYRKQVEKNNIANVERLRVKAEHDREQKERAAAERALIVAKNRERELENEKIRLDIQAKQATTNLANSVTNAASAAVDLSNVGEKLAEEKRARKQAENSLRIVENELSAVKSRVRDLEQQIQIYQQRELDRQKQENGAGREGWCSFPGHNCPSDRCPDLTCRQ